MSMAWYLQSDGFQLRVGSPKVVGRDMFPEEAYFSRKHFSIFEKYGRTYIQDLGSRNGTLVNGRALQPNTPCPLAEEDVLQVGDRQFKLSRSDRVIQSGYVLAGSSVVSFLCWAAYVLAQPAADFGRSTSFSNLMVMAASLLLAVTVPPVVCYFFFPDLVWSPRNSAIYMILVVLMSGFFSHCILDAADWAWDMRRDVATERVAYFCARKFDAPQCAAHLFSCPTCVKALTSKERMTAMDRLREFQRELDLKAQQLRKPRQPASLK